MRHLAISLILVFLLFFFITQHSSEQVSSTWRATLGASYESIHKLDRARDDKESSEDSLYMTDEEGADSMQVVLNNYDCPPGPSILQDASKK